MTDSSRLRVEDPNLARGHEHRVAVAKRKRLETPFVDLGNDRTVAVQLELDSNERTSGLDAANPRAKRRRLRGRARQIELVRAGVPKRGSG